MFPLRDDRPTFRTPIVTILLMVACALVFLHDRSLSGIGRVHFIEKYALVPSQLRLTTLLTSLFLHGGWLHIIGNMMFLWAFGKSLEDAMGHGKFLAFYLLCGIAGGLVHSIFHPYSTIPSIGASGAIAGVMGAYLITFPRAYIHTLVVLVVFVTVADIPAAFVLLYWFAIQVVSGYTSVTHIQVVDAGTAYFAHIGGFVAGMLLITVMGTRRRYLRR